MFANHYIVRARSAFITATITALVIACSPKLYAQSPLTIQPSTGRVGVGTTTPYAKIEAKGTDVGISVMNSAGTQNYYFGIKDSDSNKLYIGPGRDPSQGEPPAITVDAARNVSIGNHLDMLGGIFVHDRGDGCCADFRLGVNGQETHLYSLSSGRFAIHKYGVGSSSGEVFSILPSGEVGIGTTSPSFLLHVNGSAGKPGGGSWSSASDARLKKNIEGLHGVLDKILRLRSVSFEYKDPAAINELPGTQIGMVAQEVETVFPQWVEEGADGYKRVTYRGFEALAIEALRELRNEKDNQITELRELVNRQQSQMDELRAAMARLTDKSTMTNLIQANR